MVFFAIKFQLFEDMDYVLCKPCRSTLVVEWLFGGLLGPAVKIDKVTLGQTRGKFCRLCVEINLDEPLKPFIKLGDHSFGVVYEGISTICFNCGVYGHVCDHCTYVSKAQNVVAKVNTARVATVSLAADTTMDTKMLKSENNVVVEKSLNVDSSAKTNSTLVHGW